METDEKSPLLMWLEKQVATRYGSMTELAKRVGRDSGALKRSAIDGSAGVDTLLRLAEETGESPSAILGIAGKQDLDALIRRLYGQPTVTLPSDVQGVVDFLLSDEQVLKAAQAGMIEHAKLLYTLRRSPASESGHSSEKPPVRPGTRARRGTQRK